MAISAAASAAIGAGASTTGGIFGAAIGAKVAKKNREWQEKMFDKANQFNAEQATLAYQRTMDEWDRQFNATNAYNDPSAQMQRMLAAGINPYNASQSISPTSQYSGTPSAPSASSVAPPQNSSPFSNPVQDFLNTSQNTLQNALNTLQTTKGISTVGNDVASTNIDNDPYTATLRNYAAQNAFEAQAVESVYNKGVAQFKLANISSEASSYLSNMLTQAAFNRANLRSANASADVMESNAKYAEQNWVETLKNLRSQGLLTRTQERMLNKQYYYYDSITEANINLTNNQAKQAKAGAYMNSMLGTWYGVQSSDLLATRPYRIGNLQQDIKLKQLQGVNLGLTNESQRFKNRWATPHICNLLEIGFYFFQ